jgi:uracil-DNA glycosylase family 4
MLKKPDQCKGCPLYATNNYMGFSQPEGRCKSGVLIIGEALGDREKYDGLPFRPYAEAGSSLQTAIRLLGKEREDFAFWNMIGCQPPFNKLEGADYEFEAIEHCKFYFKHVIEHFKPKVILALGNVPLKHLMVLDDETLAHQDKLKSTDLRQYRSYMKKFKISSLRGYVLPSIYKIPIIPSLHPSFIAREGRIYIGVLMRDLSTAIDLAKGKIPPFKVDYNENPSYSDARNFYEYCAANPEFIISHDIETPDTTIETDESEIEYENIEVRNIDSIQFSVEEGKAIFFPWRDEYAAIAEKILRLPNSKVGWNNWDFDRTNIEYHIGKGAIKGLNIDAMWAWKWLNQDFVTMGRGLQFATNFFAPNFPAWKHIAQLHPEKYGCYDPDAALRIINGLQKELQAKRLFPDTKSLWDGFIDDCVKLKPILEDVQDRGFPIDPDAREIFKTKIERLREETINELQDLFPMELRSVSPLQGYKFEPKEVTEVRKLFEQAEMLTNPGVFYVVEHEETTKLRMAQYLEEHTRHFDDDNNEETTGLVLKEFAIDGTKEIRYCRMEKFKPTSAKQVIRYIEWMAKKGKLNGYKKNPYKVAKKHDRIKGEDRDTTGKDELYALWGTTNDRFFELVILYRELDKMLQTYVGTGKSGWKTGHDGRVHTTFTFKPATGQLSSVNPNIQNAPARGTRFSSEGYKELATEFRRTVAASSGKILLSADWSAFHALTLAFEAEDAEYMRVVKIDPHSFVAAHILNEELPNRIHLFKAQKPNNITHEKWQADILLAEEAIERFNNIHSWLQLSDEDLTKQLRWIKKNYKFNRDSQAKPALLGMGFGMKVRKFFKLNQHTFRSEAEPARILALIIKLFPRSFRDYHETIKTLADKQTYLITRYGYLRRFYDVYDWRLLGHYQSPKAGEQVIKNKKGQFWLRREGVDAESCIAYLPSNDAFGKKKEAMRDLWEYESDGIIRNCVQEFGLINEIHDDLMWEVEISKLEIAARIIKTVMESPARYLKNSTAPNGLVCKVELKAGPNWAEMKDLNL